MCYYSFLSWLWSCLFCYLNWTFYLILGSMFLVGMLFMYVAMLAYVNVCRDYSKWAIVGFKQAIIRQYELPPIDCFKRDVSLLSLYGGRRFTFPVVVDSYRDAITCLSVNKLLLISIPSLNTTPVDLVALCLSLPARSTISSLLSICYEGSSSKKLWTLKVRRQWDRLEVLFILWDPIILFFWPFLHHFKAYSEDRHWPSNIF